MKGKQLIYESILDRIGKTPLVRIRELARDLSPDVEIWAKLEYFNPGGSVKDRAAYRMVQEGIKNGELTPDKIIMDPTSGNTGVAYAMIGAALGYKVELVMPANASRQRKDIAEAYGAKIVFSSRFEGSDGAIRLAKKMYAENSAKYFMPDQYNNTMNPRAHYDTTGVEIWEQTKGRVTHFVATLGTSGTAMGTSRRLKDYNKNIYSVGVQPEDALHGLEGLKHMPTSIVPGIYHEKELDEVVGVATEPSYDLADRLGKEEGLLVGYSSGAALLTCRQLAKKIRRGVIVTIFPDHGDRYFE